MTDFTQEEIRRARNLDRKLRAKQLELYKAQEEAKIRRKQQLRDSIDPPKVVAKVKKINYNLFKRLRLIYRQLILKN